MEKLSFWAGSTLGVTIGIAVGMFNGELVSIALIGLGVGSGAAIVAIIGGDILGWLRASYPAA